MEIIIATHLLVSSVIRLDFQGYGPRPSDQHNHEGISTTWARRFILNFYPRSVIQEVVNEYVCFTAVFFDRVSL